MEAVKKKKKKIDDEETMSKTKSHHRLIQVEDILLNLLSWLPVKTLLRFRCVCKQWHYLISNDPCLYQRHSQNFKSKPLLLFKPRIGDQILVQSMDRKGNPISSFEFTTFDSKYPRAIPTRFDLVCIIDSKNDYIFNPSTHEFIKLPDFPWSSSTISVGFGYCQSTDEYKVVHLISALNTECHVFTLGTERHGSSSSFSSPSSPSSSWAWREVVGFPVWRELMGFPAWRKLRNYPIEEFYCSYMSAFVNGATHWMEYDNYKIIAFDIKSEEFRLLPPPEGIFSLRLNGQALILVELKGLLCLSCTIYPKMEIWMLKDYYCKSGNDHISGTWVKEYSINLNHLPYRHLRDRYSQNYGYGFGIPRDIEDTKVLIEITGKGLGYYDLQTKKFEVLVRSPTTFYYWSLYVESLRSLKRTSSTGEEMEAAETKAKLID